MTVEERDKAITRISKLIKKYWDLKPIEELGKLTSDQLFEELSNAAKVNSSSKINFVIDKNTFLFQTYKMVQ